MNDRLPTLSTVDIGDGPPAVLLHGQPGSCRDWLPVTSRLADRMRVIAPDRPGYGRTGGRAAGFAGNTAALVALLDRLGIDSAVLAGHSWATGVALAVAIRHPERVRALVLAAPVAPGIPPGSLDRALARPFPGLPAAMLGFKLAGWGLALPPVRKLLRTAVPTLQPGEIGTRGAEWRWGRVWRSFYAEQRALVAELPSLAPHLRSVEIRTIILHGTRDRITPTSHAQALVGALPDARRVSVKRAGHMLPRQRPGLLAETIERAAT